MMTILSLVGLISTVACSERVQPGHVGIVVSSYGSDRGVQDYPATTGRVWYNPFTTEVFQYPTFMQTATAQTTFNDKNGMAMGVTVGVGYTLIANDVPGFYVKFRTEDITAFTGGFFNNEFQAAFNAEGAKYTAEEIYSGQKETLLDRVKIRLNDRLKPYGVFVEQFAIQGEMALPQQIKSAIDAKIQATQSAQRVENELRETQAEAQKQVAQAEGQAKASIARAQGQAQANRVLNESLTSNLMEWRKLDIQQAQMNKWDGKMPQTMLGSTPNVLLGIKQ